MEDAIGSRRWVCLDVGETLVDETRIWSTWADMVGVPRLTFMAMLGAVIARDADHRDVFEQLGVGEWEARWPEASERVGPFIAEDLYPDALPAARALATGGYRVAVIGNQPGARSAELRALGFEPDVMAMSDEMRVSKPDPAFFARSLELMGGPDPSEVAYVGDRVDNDVLPALARGMRAIWIRRGPWGRIQALPDGVKPALVVHSLTELVDRVGGVWD
jgi:HAD superfamily hydrolase (TIGR01549 family)